MNSYEEMRAQIANKIAESNSARGRVSSSVSKTDLEAMAHSMLNTPEHEYSTYGYTKDDEGNQVLSSNARKPVERYRNSLKPMLKAMGMDVKDTEAVETVPITKEHASAMLEVSSVVIKDYMEAGRKYALPVTSDAETKMEMSITTAPAKTSVNRFSKEPSTVQIKERKVLKAKNSTPAWLKIK